MTKARILEVLASADALVPVADIAVALGVTPNAVRRHLADLRSQGLVREHVEKRTARGRPRFFYESVPQPSTTPPGERLASMLASALAIRSSPREVGRASAEGPPLDDDGVVSEMRADGFEPREERDGGRFVLVLEKCPFASVAAAHPGVVCSLHRGVADALAERAGRAVADLVVADPDRGGCRVTFSTL
jgi:predicted ArsR family transcriptional regulator